MKIIFWVSFVLITAVYFGYPLFLIIATFFRKKAVHKSDLILPATLIIPAYNEEKSIREKIENSLSLDYPKDKLEIIVISDSSTDKTEDIVKEYIGRGIKLIIQDPRKGKMAALNKAVPQAKGEIIVFSDANTMYDPHALRMLIRNFSDSNIVCVCGNSMFITKKSSSVELGFSAYMKYERFIWSMESQMRSLLVVDGAIYAIRKGLFSPIDEVLADDFVNPLRMGAMGYGVIYEPEAKAEEKAVSNIQEEFKRKIRVTFQGYTALMYLWPLIFKSGLLRIFQYFLHKLLRWLVPFFLLSMFICSLLLIGIDIYRYLFVGQFLFYVSAFIGYVLQKKGSKEKIFYVPFYFCLINLASVAGLFQAIKGSRGGAWEKAETTR